MWMVQKIGRRLQIGESGLIEAECLEEGQHIVEAARQVVNCAERADADTNRLNTAISRPAPEIRLED